MLTQDPDSLTYTEWQVAEYSEPFIIRSKGRCMFTGRPFPKGASVRWVKLASSRRWRPSTPTTATRRRAGDLLDGELGLATVDVALVEALAPSELPEAVAGERRAGEELAP